MVGLGKTVGSQGLPLEGEGWDRKVGDPAGRRRRRQGQASRLPLALPGLGVGLLGSLPPSVRVQDCVVCTYVGTRGRPSALTHPGIQSCVPVWCTCVWACPGVVPCVCLHLCTGIDKNVMCVWTRVCKAWAPASRDWTHGFSHNHQQQFTLIVMAFA